MVSKEGFNIGHKGRYLEANKNHTMIYNVSTWIESMTHDFKLTYQATEAFWNPTSKY